MIALEMDAQMTAEVPLFTSVWVKNGCIPPFVCVQHRFASLIVLVPPPFD